MSDVRLELDLDDARRLQRLAELGDHIEPIFSENARVLAYLSLSIVQAERRAAESRELAVFGPATEVTK